MNSANVDPLSNGINGWYPAAVKIDEPRFSHRIRLRDVDVSSLESYTQSYWGCWLLWHLVGGPNQHVSDALPVAEDGGDGDVVARELAWVAGRDAGDGGWIPRRV